MHNLTAAVAYLLTTLFATTAFAELVSDFSTDADGWTASTFADDAGRPNFILSLQTGLVPQHHAQGGNTAGYVSIADPDEGWTYFVAPSKLRGDQSSHLGQALIFSLQQTINGGLLANPKPPHVALQSGDTILVFDLGQVPTEHPDWMENAVLLSAGLWRVGTSVGPLAPPEQLAASLGSVTNLFISAEFVAGVVETTGLDSVIFAPTTEPVLLPAAIWYLAPAIGGLGLIRRRAAARTH